MRKTKKKVRFFRDFFLYALGFLLLLEWLYPVPYVTDTASIEFFIVATALFFILTALQSPLIVGFLLRGLVVVGTLYWLIPTNDTVQSWFSYFLDDLFYNLFLMLAGNFTELTEMHRSFLFLVLLAILSYLLFYWIVYARRILFFLLLSLIYIGTIDTFTTYDGTWSIIRTFLIGLFLLGILTFIKRAEQNGATFASFGFLTRMFALLLLCAAFAGSVAFAMPKPEPQWPDPIPYLQSAFGFSAGTNPNAQRIGYSVDDSNLGGGFVQDDSPVFVAEVEEGHYWKGETKNLYTGTGWDQWPQDSEKVTPPLNASMDRSGVELEEQEASVRFVNESPQTSTRVFYPGELLSDTIGDDPVLLDPYTDQAFLQTEGDGPILDGYELEFYHPSYNVEELRELEGYDNNADYLAEFLQLPDELPERVHELAEEIVEEADADNPYDMAKAIERFFSGPEFEYETTDVPVPAEGEDYVDQFLFETRRGYCDNFSTSMAVMLRTLDVPTRWVKGFTEGSSEELTSADGELEQYLITNNNAHSWVEVYFEGAGWVPFEPTKGFTSTVDFEEPSLETDEPDAQIPEPEEPEAPSEPEAEESEEAPESESGTEDAAETTSPFSIGHGVSFLVLVVGLLLLYIFRKPLARAYVGLRFRNRERPDTFIKAYEHLLWLLRLHGYKRAATQTLGEYARNVDESLGSAQMEELTALYEKFLYGRKKEAVDWNRYKDVWQKMLNQINS
ncbi:DUF4129 domain-containing transglutaminase family protein [Shouchella shacheensis]|uniref:DUF4129 domain-containing transglutaminase family protein n=1 Tax=Shouchella shacheensis TaxID=1649580 RepID=UPI0007400529|nr:transglutaminase domain-containing protein [Shouchella shacheensis]